MAKHKLKRFAEFELFENTFAFAREMKGKWHEHFGNNNPIVLELACGKGEYALGLAQMFPERNYIGIDIKGNRMWRGAKTADENGWKNVAFLRTQIDHIEEYFEKGEVSEIWITFADPQPQDSREKKRLTHPRFLAMYRNIGKDNITVNLKCDSDLLYEYTLEVIDAEKLPIEMNNNNIYNWADRPEVLDIKTFYEMRWLGEGKKIKYIRYKINK